MMNQKRSNRENPELDSESQKVKFMKKVFHLSAGCMVLLTYCLMFSVLIYAFFSIAKVIFAAWSGEHLFLNR